MNVTNVIAQRTMQFNRYLLLIIFAVLSMSCGKDEHVFEEKQEEATTNEKMESDNTDPDIQTSDGEEDEDSDAKSSSETNGESIETDDNAGIDDGDTNHEGTDGKADSTTDSESSSQTDNDTDENKSADESDNQESITDSEHTNYDEETNTLQAVKYMDLQCETGMATQASASYGDYLIQSYTANKCMTFYNLKERYRIGSIAVPAPTPNNKIHCNSINFGSQRYESNDYFPVLYVCSGNKISDVSQIYVYRIKKNDENFSIELVQTIFLEGFGSWTEGIPDNDQGYLWIRHNGGNQKFNIPDVHDGDVTINIEEQLESASFKNTVATDYTFGAWQAHTFINERLVWVTGVPSRGQNLALLSANMITHEIDYMLDLKSIGLVNAGNPKDNAYEPEGIIYYEGKYMVCYKSFIYAIDTDIE